MTYDNYFTVQESEQFTFYRVPKALFTYSKYKSVSAEAKLLYGLHLDRMGLSAKNGGCEYILECLDKNPADIRNIRAYLLTALYNAPVTMDSYYSALVNHDLYGRTS